MRSGINLTLERGVSITLWCQRRGQAPLRSPSRDLLKPIAGTVEVETSDGTRGDPTSGAASKLLGCMSMVFQGTWVPVPGLHRGRRVNSAIGPRAAGMSEIAPRRRTIFEALGLTTSRALTP